MSLRKIRKSSMRPEEDAEFRRLMLRLGLYNDSKAIKVCVTLAHVYLDKIEDFVPQAIFECYLENLKYQKKAYIAKSENS